MKQSHKLDIKRSTIRQKLNDLALVEELSDEQRTEIETRSAELSDAETQFRAAVLAEDEEVQRAVQGEPDAEERALKELEGNVSVCDYLGAASSGRAIAGAAHEFNQALNLKDGQFPMRMLDPGPGAEEHRAETDADTIHRPGNWVDRVFSTSAAQRLVTFRSVPAGVAVYPVTSAGAAAVQRARMEAVSASAWSVGTVEMRPKAMTTQIIFSREDALRNPGLEDSLRRDMRAALIENTDRAIFLGDSGADGTDADIVGLTTAAIGESTLTQAKKIKGTDWLNLFVGLIDGKYAETVQDLRIVLSVGSNKLVYGTVHAAAVENQTVAQFLMASGLNWTARGDIDTATAADDFGGLWAYSVELMGLLLKRFGSRLTSFEISTATRANERLS